QWHIPADYQYTRRPADPDRDPLAGSGGGRWGAGSGLRRSDPSDDAGGGAPLDQPDSTPKRRLVRYPMAKARALCLASTAMRNPGDSLWLHRLTHHRQLFLGYHRAL